MAEADKKVLELIKEQHKRAKKMLNDNIEALHRCSLYLLEHETISGEEFMRILNDTSLLN